MENENREVLDKAMRKQAALSPIRRTEKGIALREAEEIEDKLLLKRFP